MSNVRLANMKSQSKGEYKRVLFASLLKRLRLVLHSPYGILTTSTDGWCLHGSDNCYKIQWQVSNISLT